MNQTQNKYTDEQIREARSRLWYVGNLTWKLDPTQKKIYDFIKGVSQKTVIVNCARRLGKSHMLTIIAIEQCLQKERSIVKFLQPEQKMIRVNIRPIMEKILSDCPPDLKPVFKTQDNIYVFPNGSEIQLAGTDNGNHEKLRGGDSDICIIDEAAFVKSELQYIVRSVLLPTTMLTRGKILLSSTSPKEPEHDFAKYMQSAEMSNSFIRKTIYDALDDNKNLENPRFTPEIVNEIINEYPGGVNSDDFRRECLCEIITDGDNSVIPEFTAAVQQEIIKSWPRPVFCDRYVSMDVGFRDLTSVLFAFYDFDNGVIVVEDEICINGPQMTTDKLAELIRIKERELWTDPLTNDFIKPYMRVSDNNLILINDLQRLHGITFLPTAKDNKDAAINNMRMLIGGYQVYIDPKCRTLINHLKYATWNKNRTDFVRSPDNGHYDSVDSLIYLLRTVDRNKNPYPVGYRYKQMGHKDNVFLHPSVKNLDPKLESLGRLFKPRKSTKK